MANAQILNLEPRPPAAPEPPEPPEPQVPPVVDEFTQTRKMIDEARSDVQRIRRQVERQAEEHETHEKRTKVLSMFLGVLIVLFAGALWFAYPTMANGKKTLSDVYSLQNISNTLGEHLNSVEANLKKVSADFPALSDRMDKLQANMKTNLQVARNQAQAAATQAGKRLQDEINQSLQAIQSRVSGLESNQKESSERVTRLQEQVAGLQQQITRMREEAATKATGLSEPETPAQRQN